MVTVRDRFGALVRFRGRVNSVILNVTTKSKVTLYFKDQFSLLTNYYRISLQHHLLACKVLH